MRGELRGRDGRWHRLWHDGERWRLDELDDADVVPTPIVPSIGLTKTLALIAWCVFWVALVALFWIGRI